MSTERGPRFITCGEALIDLVPADADPDDTFASSWRALSAGGPMNTAVALAASGADSHFLGRFSQDAFGDQLRGHVSGAGVGIDSAVSSELPTSIAVVSLDDSGKASYAFHCQETANFGWQPDELPTLTPGDWLHIGSLAIVLPPGAETLLDWVRQVPAPVSVDVNARPAVIGDPSAYWQRVEPWLRAVGSSGAVKASDDDLAFLEPALDTRSTTATPDSKPAWRHIAERWLTDYSLGLVVITRGPDGASALDSDGRWIDVPGRRAEVVDTVGAGDTFMAGFLDGWVRGGDDLCTSLQRGVVAAAIVCERQGAQPPTAAEIDARVGHDPS